MPCYSPLRAFQQYAGAPLFFGESGKGSMLFVGCGQCVGCRLDYARTWAVRCTHESKMHASNCFLTLTYDDAHLPADLSLYHRHFQLFMKRLRESLSENSRPLIRYFMCGEYGSINSRPHYHSAIFGFYPEDAVYWQTTKAGFKLFTSAYLDSHWQLGRVFVGDLSFESASYIARYVLKKADADLPMREIIDVTTGLTNYRAHEYSKMSLRPGIGASFVEKYGTDVFPHDRVVIRGVKSPVPRYYNVLLERISPVYDAINKAGRVARGELKSRKLDELYLAGGLPMYGRLKSEEIVKRAQISNLKRS